MCETRGHDNLIDGDLTQPRCVAETLCEILQEVRRADVLVSRLWSVIQFRLYRRSFLILTSLRPCSFQTAAATAGRDSDTARSRTWGHIRDISQ
ncbi:MAG: hypothetical protein J07HQX50_00110 [Haloquadratum sp. J07HQX50]|nr:MAG: hypothetical protein J07HQX50_00110 [Haloquadratum sp. J07HQX50]